MGYTYRRGTKIWLGYHDTHGRLRQMSTGLDHGSEEAARAILVGIEAQVAAGVEPTAAPRPATVRAYERRWTADRKAQGVCSADDEGARLRLHAMPVIGDMKIEEVRPRHVRDLMRGLRAKGTLAPRSVRHIYGALRTLFRDAVVDELIPSSPCVVHRSDLPKSADKDPTWRAGAVFTRAELERLLSDEKVPDDRRVLYAILGLAGLRFGEASALRWRSYDAPLAPLGRLLIATSWSTTTKREKATKSERPRMVPVHPVLARILAAWKLGGWQAMMGRAPGPDDLVIPSRFGRNRSRHHSLVKFHEDLDRLALRRRRQHDLRRTFVTLARADGASKDVLETVTHGGRGDTIDLYTSLPWACVCDEVAKLNVQLVGLHPIAALTVVAPLGLDAAAA